MVAVAPMPFQTFFRMNDGQALDQAFGYPVVSTEDSIVAHSGGTQAAAYQLTATISRVITSAAGTDSVAMPPANVGLNLWVINDAAANSMQVFGNAALADTINGIATATGISQPAGTIYQYTCTTAGKWITKQVSDTFTNLVTGSLSVTAKMTYTGARVGTFVNNGATGVTTANTLVTANSMILFSMNTPGGTVAGSPPNVLSITPATNFVTKGTASDSSTYNYMIIENQ